MTAPTIATRFRVLLKVPGMGSFLGSLTLPQLKRADIRRSPADSGAVGWMVGANPKFRTFDRAGPVTPPGAALPVQAQALRHRAGSHRWRWIAILSAFVPLSFVLVQCGQAPSAGTLAANVQGPRGDSFDDRFPKPQFKDRFPTPGESLLQLQASDAPRPAAPARAAAGTLSGCVAGADGALPASGHARTRPRWSA